MTPLLVVVVLLIQFLPLVDLDRLFHSRRLASFLELDHFFASLISLRGLVRVIIPLLVLVELQQVTALLLGPLLIPYNRIQI